MEYQSSIRTVLLGTTDPLQLGMPRCQLGRIEDTRVLLEIAIILDPVFKDVMATINADVRLWFDLWT